MLFIEILACPPNSIREISENPWSALLWVHDGGGTTDHADGTDKKRESEENSAFVTNTTSPSRLLSDPRISAGRPLDPAAIPRPWIARRNTSAADSPRRVARRQGELE